MNKILKFLRSLYFWEMLTMLVIFFAVSKVLAVFGALMVSIAWYIKYEKIEKQKRKDALKKALIVDANVFLEKIKKDGSLPAVRTDVLLNPGEIAYQVESSILRETRAVRQTFGSFGSVRIARGVSIGTSAARSESRQEWRTLDQGQLVLTNKRLIYLGGREKRSVSIDKITAIETYTDAIEITSDSRQKSMIFFVKNPYIWSVVIRIFKVTQGENKMPSLDVDFA
jgi:hypothetical protein